MSEIDNILVSTLRESRSKTIEVAFPSCGKFYHDEVIRPGADYDNITVHPISVVAEMILKDPILLASGRAIPKMAAQLVPDILEPDELVDIDMEVILLAARIASYGPELKIDHTCGNPARTETDQPVCDKVSPLRINLIDHIQKYPKITDWSPYRVEFEIGDGISQVVHLRRLPYRAVLAGIRQTLMNEAQLEPFKDKTFDQLILSEETLQAYEKMTEVISTTNLETVLQSIIGVEIIKPSSDGEPQKANIVYTGIEPDKVREWLWSIPGDWIVELNKRINQFAQELSEKNQMSYVCPSCNFMNKFQMELDINKLFFSRSPETSPTEPVLETSAEPNKRKSKRPSRILSR